MSGFDAAAVAVSARLPLGWVTPAAASRVRAAMQKLGVADLGARGFATLSGGQQQRLMLAGALAAGSDLLVLDEPTDGLDASSRLAFIQTVRSCLSDGLAAVLVSHDVEDLAALCTRVARLHARADESQPSRADCCVPAELFSATPVPAPAGVLG